MAKKSAGSVKDSLTHLVGRKVEELTLSERLQYANRWVAFRIYQPPGKVSKDGVEYVDMQVRRIEAVGASVEDCIGQLRRLDLNPAEFEFTVLKPPY